MIIRYLVFFDVTFILTCRSPLTCSAAGSCTTCLFALFQVSYALYEWLSLSKADAKVESYALYEWLSLSKADAKVDGFSLRSKLFYHFF